MSPSRCSSRPCPKLASTREMTGYLEGSGTAVPRVIMNDSGEPINVPTHNLERHVYN